MKQLNLPDKLQVFFPKNLNLEYEVDKDPPNLERYTDNYRKALDRIALILGQINARLISNKVARENYFGGFVPLNSKILEKLTDDSENIMAWAEKRNIIEIDHHYVPGFKSKGYRFSDRYWPELRIYYITDPHLVKKVRERRLHKPTIEAFPALIDYLSQIEIDINGAYNKLEELYQEDLINPPKKRGKKKCPIRMFEYRKKAVSRLHDREFDFQRDEKTFRLHTNITSMKRECRPFLTWQGQPLVNIDITNSQPYFSLALLLPDPYFQINNYIKQYNPSLNGHMFQKYEQMLGTYDPDYVDLVREGMLYDVLVERLGIIRDDVKKLIYKIIFAPPHWDFKYKGAFVEMFPDVWETFASINQGYYKTKKQKRKPWEQTSALALLLQRIESFIVIDRIVPAILEELPGVPIWTIHDSVMTIEDYAEEVKEIMLRVTEEFMGIAAPVHID